MATIVTSPFTNPTMPNLAVEVVDNDIPKLVVSASGSVTAENGTSAVTLSVALGTNAAGLVTVTAYTDDPTEGAAPAGGSTIFFTPADSQQPQTLTIEGVDDGFADGTVGYVIRLVAESGSDTAYDQLSHSVALVNLDDDVAGVVFDPAPNTAAARLATSEAGASVSISMVLTSVPEDNVTFAYVLVPATEASATPSNITFGFEDWNITKTIVVTGLDDTAQDGPVAYQLDFIADTTSSDPSYPAMPLASFFFVNGDDDTAGVDSNVSSTDTLTMVEGDNLPIAVEYWLMALPTAEVTVTITSSDPGEVGVSLPGSAAAGSMQVVVSAASWNDARVFELSALPDRNTDGNQTVTISFATASADPAYQNLLVADRITVLNVDVDLPGFEFCTGAVDCPFDMGRTTEQGGVATARVRLKTLPTAAVAVAFSSSNPLEGAITTTLTFTAADWETFQQIVVTGVDDAVDDGDQTYTVSASVSTTDGSYTTATIPLWTLVNENDDTNECANTSVPCSFVCTDPDFHVASDWQCSCPAHLQGSTTVATDALCLLDECLVSGSVCTTVNQICADPNKDPSSTSDWVCMCAPPYVGNATLTPVVKCMYDECSANTSLCTDAPASTPQTCVDTNLEPTSLSDWSCVCDAPMEGSEVGGVAVCTIDECVAKQPCLPPHVVTCLDPNTSHVALGDWTCTCVPPFRGQGTAAEVPVCFLDECSAELGKLAKFCRTIPFQKCRDANQFWNSTDDWACVCEAPAIGDSAVRGIADCDLNECRSFRFGNETCHVPTGGVGFDQECVDPNPHPLSLHDWYCECVGPAEGRGATNELASCTLNECVMPGNTCAANQTCFDPNENAQEASSFGDWECWCQWPHQGDTTVGGPASCFLDECNIYNAVCDSSQHCEDRNSDATALDDWGCYCNPPATGSAVASVATCTVDECATYGDVCLSQGQTCNETDESASALDDWFCECAPPLEGWQFLGAADCALDECGFAPCGAGQACADRDQRPAAGNSFVCSCVFPQMGDDATGAPAACYLDECALYNATCADEGQACTDPNPAIAARDDWTCSCVLPFVGIPAVAGFATCSYDECDDVTICRDFGQLCSDTNERVLDDWLCECTLPTAGAPAVGGLADCVYDECAGGAGAVCAAAGQECADWDLRFEGTWQCECVFPEFGPAGAGAPAACVVDHCHAGNPCAVAAQDCAQDDGGWTCTCRRPYYGSDASGPAACALDECDIGAAGEVCAKNNQVCADGPGVGDWNCSCKAGFTGGAAAAALAPCRAVRNECHANTVCSAVGQVCIDGNISEHSFLDWECHCAPPTHGDPARAEPARCIVDECANNTACAGQTPAQLCVDPNTKPTAPGDWMCACAAPYNGSTVGSPALCTHKGECADGSIVAFCQSAGQVCEDEDSTRSGNWQCACLLPLVGKATADIAVCIDPDAKLGAAQEEDDGVRFSWGWLVFSVSLFLACAGFTSFIVAQQSQKAFKARQAQADLEEKNRAAQEPPAPPAEAEEEEEEKSFEVRKDMDRSHYSYLPTPVVAPARSPAPTQSSSSNYNYSNKPVGDFSSSEGPPVQQQALSYIPHHYYDASDPAPAVPNSREFR
ncbi:Neurogenic locus Notch protein [Diplonema papillatum]|nr:Neurogenic locus Notch protein [Diplonema papillatum]